MSSKFEHSLIMKKRIYLLCFLTFKFLNQTFAINEPNCSQSNDAKNITGITVIVHGFQLLGISSSTFLDYAFKLKTRIGKDATIYVNDSKGNRFYWDKIAGDGKGELIFVYNWAANSNTPSAGPLEASADKLFCLLVNPYDENGCKIAEEGALFSKPSHFIAHSRGAILSLQVFHRIGKYFPKKRITQFTALDPHPAAYMSDVYREDNIPGLPGVIGDAYNCFFTFCSNSKKIAINIPENVLNAECYYREEGTYESITNFDGVKILDGYNIKLIDSTLKKGGISGMPHSLVHEWYFGTVDSLTSLPEEWYKQTGGRQNSGFYHSRLGGGNYLNGRKRITINSMDEHVKKRQDKYPLYEIFNGTVLYSTSINAPVNWMAQGFNGANIIVNQNTLVPNFHNQRYGEIVYNAPIYIPEYRKYLVFDINSINMSPTTHITFHWTMLDGGKPGEPVAAPQQSGTRKYYLEIPPMYIGHNVTFKLVFRNSINIGNFSLDNFELTDSPEGANGSGGYCPDFNVSISPQNPPTICNGEPVTLTASDGADNYRWLINGVQVGMGKVITTKVAGTYSVEATKTTRNCKTAAKAEVNVVENSTIQFNIKVSIPNNNSRAYDSTSKILTLCPGQSTTLTGTGCDGSISWSNGSTAGSINVSMAGNYSATCRIGQNCQKTDNITVKIETATTPTVAKFDTLRSDHCGLEAISLDANTPTEGRGAWSIYYPNGNTLGSFSNIYDPRTKFTPRSSGKYVLQWTIALHCNSSREGTSSALKEVTFVDHIKVKELKAKSSEYPDIFLVTASPGGIFTVKYPSPSDTYVGRGDTCFDYQKRCLTVNRIPFYEVKVKYEVSSHPCPNSERTIIIR